MSPVHWSRLGRVAAAVLLCGMTLAATLGAGYRATRLVLDDTAAYLGENGGVERAIAVAGRTEARTERPVGSRKADVDVAEADGAVLARNRSTDEVAVVDPASMRMTGIGKGRQIAGGGSELYLLDERGTLRWLDRTAPPRVVPTPVAADGVAAVAVDSHGTAWAAAPESGRIYRVERATVQAQRDLGFRTRSSGVRLTLVDDRPVVLDTVSGHVVGLTDAGTMTSVATLPPGGSLKLALPGATDSRLRVVDPATRQLLDIVLPTGTMTRTDLPASSSHQLGRPAVTGTRVFVPDFAVRQVYAVPPAGGHSAYPVRGAKDRSEFDILVRDGRLWINDQDQPGAQVIEPDGAEHDVRTSTGAPGDTEHRRSPPELSAPPADKPPAAPPPTRPQPTAPRLPGPTTVAGTSSPTTSTPPPPPPTGSPTVAVPDVTGQQEDDACRAVESAGLTCQPKPVSSAQGQVGEVLQLMPGAGSRVVRGYLVTAGYHAPVVSDVRGRLVDDACLQIERQRLRCTVLRSGAAASPAEFDRVTAVTPAPATAVPLDTEVTIVAPDRVPGVPISTTVGQPVTEARATLQREGFLPVLTDQGNACNTGQRPGVVLTQVPATRAQPGSTVQLTYYAVDQCTVPPVTGTDPDTACAQVQAAGLTCQRVPDMPTRTPNTVGAQSPGGGTVLASGSAVQVHYYLLGPTPLKRYKRLGENVWVISADPGRGVPLGYEESGPVGWAFDPNQPTQPAELAWVLAWQCYGGAAVCGGHDQNHFFGVYGESPPPGDYRLMGYAALVVPGPSCDASRGLTTLVRLARPGTTEFAYAASAGDLAYYRGRGFADAGILGCIWAS